MKLGHLCAAVTHAAGGYDCAMRRCRRGMAASFADGSAGAQGVVSSRSAVGGHRICGRPKFEPPSCSCARHRRRGGEGARGCSVAAVTFLLTLAVATSEPTGVRDHVYSPGTLHPTLRATLPPWSKGRGGIAQGAELLRAKRLNRPLPLRVWAAGQPPSPHIEQELCPCVCQRVSPSPAHPSRVPAARRECGPRATLSAVTS